MTDLWTPVDFENAKLYDPNPGKGFDWLSVSSGKVALNATTRKEGAYSAEFFPVYGGTYYWAFAGKVVNNLSRIRQAFYLHPNGVTMGEGAYVTIARNFHADTTQYVYRLLMRWTEANGYQLNGTIYTSADSGSGSANWALPSQDGWNLIELDWIESASGNTFFVWIDGVNKWTKAWDTSGCKVNYPGVGVFAPTVGVTGGSYLIDYWRANGTGDLIGGI